MSNSVTKALQTLEWERQFRGIGCSGNPVCVAGNDRQINQGSTGSGDQQHIQSCQQPAISLASWFIVQKFTQVAEHQMLELESG